MWRRPNGMQVGRMRVPIGLIGIIYESRPNVTADSAALCLKSGNGVLLRGGSEAVRSNAAIADVLNRAGAEAGIPDGAVSFIDNPDRACVMEMLRAGHSVDLIIPRGGEGLIRMVSENSTVPVIKHDKGVCHVYVDSGAEHAMASDICLNAKVQRPGTCNAMEAMLVHKDLSRSFRIGASDDLARGQSTFMVEMSETANILNNATARSLIILDEIGWGTSTYDGVSIAWATVAYIHNHPKLRSKTLFATHYHELTQLADLLPGVRNYNVAVSEADGQVLFLHKIVPGGADRSYGIHVGQLAGLPRPVIQRAGEIMQQLEASSGKAMKINPSAPRQLALFPDTNPLVEELKSIDLNSITPIEAMTRLYDWQRRFVEKKTSEDEHP